MESLSLQSITNNKPYQILVIVRISNTLSVVGHIGAGGAIGVSIGVVGIVLLGIVSTTLVVVNTVLAELAAGAGGCKEIKVYHFTAILLHKP